MVEGKCGGGVRGGGEAWLSVLPASDWKALLREGT